MMKFLIQFLAQKMEHGWLNDLLYFADKIFISWHKMNQNQQKKFKNHWKLHFSIGLLYSELKNFFAYQTNID